jgi:aspartate aminotransferase
VLETSQRTRAVAKALESLSSFFAESAWARRHKEADVCDFAFGNPQEWPLPELVEALRFHATPRSTDWFAYKADEQETCAVIADALGKKLGLPFETEDIAVTNGAFAALVVAIHLLTDPGDEVLFSTPPWFCYEALIVNAGAVAAKVPVTIPSFDLDLEAIGRAITPHTRIVIVNSPHNPTGRVYSSEVLAGLAAILQAASRRNGHRIWLLSDECYREIVFDGLGFCSPASIYPYTLIAYSYAKKLLTPASASAISRLPRRVPTGSNCAMPCSRCRARAAGALPTPCCSTPSGNSRHSRSTWAGYSANATEWWKLLQTLATRFGSPWDILPAAARADGRRHRLRAIVGRSRRLRCPRPDSSIRMLRRSLKSP